MNTTAFFVVLLHLVACFHLLSASGKCTRPKDITHATASVEPWETEFVEGTKVKYTCDSGYSGNGNNEARCVQEQGRTYWSEAKFACKVVADTTSLPWTTRFKNWWNRMMCSVGVSSSC